MNAIFVDLSLRAPRAVARWQGDPAAAPAAVRAACSALGARWDAALEVTRGRFVDDDLVRDGYGAALTDDAVAVLGSATRARIPWLGGPVPDRVPVEDPDHQVRAATLEAAPDLGAQATAWLGLDGLGRGFIVERERPGEVVATWDTAVFAEPGAWRDADVLLDVGVRDALAAVGFA